MRGSPRKLKIAHRQIRSSRRGGFDGGAPATEEEEAGAGGGVEAPWPRSGGVGDEDGRGEAAGQPPVARGCCWPRV